MIGKQKVQCPTCKGEGYLRPKGEWERECPKCHGIGTIMVEEKHGDTSLDTGVEDKPSKDD